jgi:hypothetical protein
MENTYKQTNNKTFLQDGGIPPSRRKSAPASRESTTGGKRKQNQWRPRFAPKKKESKTELVSAPPPLDLDDVEEETSELSFARRRRLGELYQAHSNWRDENFVISHKNVAFTVMTGGWFRRSLQWTDLFSCENLVSDLEISRVVREIFGSDGVRDFFDRVIVPASASAAKKAVSLVQQVIDIFTNRSLVGVADLSSGACDGAPHDSLDRLRLVDELRWPMKDAFWRFKVARCTTKKEVEADVRSLDAKAATLLLGVDGLPLKYTILAGRLNVYHTDSLSRLHVVRLDMEVFPWLVSELVISGCTDLTALELKARRLQCYNIDPGTFSRCLKSSALLACIIQQTRKSMTDRVTSLF